MFNRFMSILYWPCELGGKILEYWKFSLPLGIMLAYGEWYYAERFPFITTLFFLVPILCVVGAFLSLQQLADFDEP